MKIYLDACCLNRPFDDQAQERIRLEAEAVMLILKRVQDEDWVWYSSDVVIDEIQQTPDSGRRLRVIQLNAHATRVHHLTGADVTRARTIAAFGFAKMDALHLACAESCGADVFLTTDDRLLRRAGRLPEQLQVVVENPLQWLVGEQGSDHDN